MNANDINYHIYKMAEECGVFLIINHEYDLDKDIELYKYILNMEPVVVESNNIVNLDAYRRIRKKEEKDC